MTSSRNHNYRWPLHSLLLPIVFILHVSNEYFGLIPFEHAATFLMYYLAVAVFLIAIGNRLFRSVSKAGLWATGFLLIFFFFGAVHDVLKSIPGFSSVTSYKILIPSLAALFFLYSLYVYFRKSGFYKMNKYLNQLFVILLTFEFIMALMNVVSGKLKDNNYAHNNKEVISIDNCQSCIKPDIFFIVFDEYTSSLALKKYLQFNNSLIDSAFSSNHFFVSAKSKSNYNSTPLSIGAAFNLQYFNKNLEGDSTVTRSLLQGWHSLKKSSIPRMLASQNYKILNLGMSHFDNYPSAAEESFNEYKIMPLYLETLAGRIKRDIWWNVYKYDIGFINEARLTGVRKNRALHVARNTTNFKRLMKELKVQDNTPKFVYCHLLLPHDPFYLNRYGQPFPDSLFGGDQNNKYKYLEQVQYANRLILEILKASNQRSSRPRVVIVEGDHGYRIPGGDRESQFMNLNAYYFSDHDYKFLYDSISPVNTFRVILNKYFQSNLLLLKDSSILLK